MDWVGVVDVSSTEASATLTNMTSSPSNSPQTIDRRLVDDGMALVAQQIQFGSVVQQVAQNDPVAGDQMERSVSLFIIRLIHQTWIVY